MNRRPRKDRWEPGSLALRFNGFWWTKVWPMANFLVSMFFALAVGLTIEGLTISGIGPWPAVHSWTVFGVAVALWIVGTVRGPSWRRANGTMIYVAAQHGEDLDRARIEAAFASHPVQVFDRPLLARSDVVRQTSASLAHDYSLLKKNAEFLVKPCDPQAPAHIASNVLWPLAIALGHHFASWKRQPAGTPGPTDWYIWHLPLDPTFDFPGEYKARAFGKDEPVEYFSRALLDVMRVRGVLRTRSSVTIEPVCKVGELDKGGVDKPRSLAIACTGALCSHKDEHGVCPRGYEWHWTRCDLGKSIDPRNFQAVAVEIAAVIAYSLRATDAELVLSARLPKPVALGIGFLLASQHGVKESDLGRIVFQQHGRPPDRLGIGAIQ